MAWTIDSAHSQISFSVRHMMISNARGRFEVFTGVIDFDENNLTTLSIDVAIETGSINTREEARDAHLRSDDFFASERFPVARFRSTGVENVAGGAIRLKGDLTIREITHPVTLDVQYAGIVTSPWGAVTAGFSGHLRINRKAWGLEWNQVLEAGGVLVGDEVKLDIELELVKQDVAETVEVA